MTDAQVGKSVNLLVSLFIGGIVVLVGIFVYYRITPVEKILTYYDGQQLLPDNTHTDTLRVMNADYLNDRIGKCRDNGEIWELLNETCETEADYRYNSAIIPFSSEDTSYSTRLNRQAKN